MDQQFLSPISELNEITDRLKGNEEWDDILTDKVLNDYEEIYNALHHKYGKRKNDTHKQSKSANAVNDHDIIDLTLDD